MYWIAETTYPKLLRYVIKVDSKAGFYTYVYEDKRVIYDDLQDTLEIAKEVASEKFGVPPDGWKTVDQPIRWEVSLGDSKRAVIKGDPILGFYLMVFENQRRVDEWWPSKQVYWSTLLEAKDVALEKYHVPMDAWQTQ